MDTLTHGLAGNLLARQSPDQSRRKGILWAYTLGSIFPDSDFILRIFGREFYLMEHRGLTHSILGLIIFPILCHFIIKRKTPENARFYSLIFAIGMLTHILMDWITNWPTYIFYPNRHQFFLDWLFIIDFYLTGSIILGIILSSIFKKYKTQIAKVFSLLFISYIFFCAYNHHQALQFMKKMTNNNPDYQYYAFPQPFSPMLWSVYAVNEEEIQHSYLNLLTPQKSLFQIHKKQQHELLAKIKEIQEYQFYMKFARVPWVTVKKTERGYLVTLQDWRFRSKLSENRKRKTFFTTELKLDSKGELISKAARKN